MLKLFNTLTRKKEIFKPLYKKQVGMYVCGPTVYWYQTIGNLRSYIFSDILRRVLKYNEYNVREIMNVTDVGHLTSDADTGEDKMEKAAKKEGKKAEDIANYYWTVFKEDFKKLNINEPTKWTKATDHISEQIELVKKLEKKGYIYKTSEGIYFDTSKLKDYGKLARLNIKGLKEGKRVNLGEKKKKTDFVLWKFSEKSGIRQQEWNSPWGIGFPGWHLECSAMAMKHLGETFDIHTGGIDHIPVHHTNEIAQSEAATGKKFVNYWLHANFLTYKGEKVSKSKGGLYTISELQEQGFAPLEYRYFCLLTHYRKALDFSLDNLKSAQNTLRRLKNKISEFSSDNKLNKNYLGEFEKAINDDLNTPRALQVVWKLVRDDKAKGKLKTIEKMDEVLGLDLLKIEKIKIPKKVKELIHKREEARKKKNWKKADDLRSKIHKLGYLLDDSSKGTIVKVLK